MNHTVSNDFYAADGTARAVPKNGLNARASRGGDGDPLVLNQATVTLKVMQGSMVLDTKETLTLSDGRNIFDNNVPIGSGHRVEGKKLYYVTTEVVAPTIYAGGVAERDITLARNVSYNTGLIYGTVHDGATVLPSAVVVISTTQTPVDADGFYSKRVLAGSYTVRAVNAGYQNYLQSGLSVSIGGSTRHDIDMPALDADVDGLADLRESSGSCHFTADADSDDDGLCKAVAEMASLVSPKAKVDPVAYAACVECHAVIYKKVSESIHGRNVMQKRQTDGALCIDCHDRPTISCPGNQESPT